MAQLGWPMAPHTWARMEGPMEADPDWLMCWWNMRRMSGRMDMA